MAITDNYVPLFQLGNGETTQFSSNWEVLNSAYITVLLQNATTGVQVPQVINVDFTLVFTSAGFTVTFAVAPTSANYVVIGRNVTIDQQDPYSTSKGYQGGTLEDSLDKLTAISQDLRETNSRTITAPLGDTATNLILPTVALRKGLALVFDVNGNVGAGAVTTTVISAAMIPVVQAATLALARTAMGAAASGANTDITSLANGTTLSATPTPGDSSLKLPTTAFVAGFLTDTNDFRLSLTTGVAVTTADVVGATSIFAVPKGGNRLALYNGTAWNTRISAQFSIALGTLTNGATYDVFCFDNAGVPTLELSAAWNSNTPGSALIFASGPYATARPVQDGVYVKSTNGTAIDASRRYMGSFTTTSTTTTEDSISNRHLFNNYNRDDRNMLRVEATTSWTYSTATFRQANGSTANQLNFTVGVVEDAVTASVRVGASSSTTAAANVAAAIGLNSTTTPSASCITYSLGVANSLVQPCGADFRGFPTLGVNGLQWIEKGNGANVQTWTNIIAAAYGAGGISGIVKA